MLRCSGNCSGVAVNTIRKQYTKYRDNLIQWEYVCQNDHPVYEIGITARYSGSRVTTDRNAEKLVGTTQPPIA